MLGRYGLFVFEKALAVLNTAKSGSSPPVALTAFSLPYRVARASASVRAGTRLVAVRGEDEAITHSWRLALFGELLRQFKVFGGYDVMVEADRPPPVVLRS